MVAIGSRVPQKSRNHMQLVIEGDNAFDEHFCIGGISSELQKATAVLLKRIHWTEARLLQASNASVRLPHLHALHIEGKGRKSRKGSVDDAELQEFSLT